MVNQCNLGISNRPVRSYSLILNSIASNLMYGFIGSQSERKRRAQRLMPGVAQSRLKLVRSHKKQDEGLHVYLCVQSTVYN